MRKLPPSEIYVLESIASLSMNGHHQQIVVTSHNEQQELTAMLVALLNTSVHHNVSLGTENRGISGEFIENRVFFLKSKLPAR